MNDKWGWSEEPEKRILGAMMLRPELLTAVRMKEDDFHSEVHRLIWRTINELAAEGTPVELVSFLSRWKSRERVPKFEIGTYLLELDDYGATGIHIITADAERVKTRAALRGVRAFAMLAQAEVESVDSRDDVRAFVDNLQRQFSEAVEGLCRDGENRGQETITEILAQFRDDYANRGQAAAITIKSGFGALDDMAEIPIGTLTVIGGRTSHGKTAFALSMLRQIADAGSGCAYFVLEDTRDWMVARLLAQRTGVSARYVVEVRTGQKNDRRSEKDWQTGIEPAITALEGAPIVFNDFPGQTVEEMRMRCRELARTGTRVFFFDHLLEIARPGHLRRTNDQVAHIARGLRDMAAELNVAVILLTQLNREAENAETGPRAHHIGESDATVQAARLIYLVDRPEKRIAKKKVDYSHPIEVRVDKATNGATGLIKLMFDPRQTLVRTPHKWELIELNKDGRFIDNWRKNYPPIGHGDDARDQTLDDILRGDPEEPPVFVNQPEPYTPF